MKKPKIIAFYLPQFHEIPENNRWWGKGFTEWTNVRRAKPLFKEHCQPRTPLNNNYYDLLDKKTFEQQITLAKKNGIYGFCYYHYWFKGKKLLEKPLEAMLKNKKLDMPFCLSWANEPWTRSWYGNKKEILMPQNYGNKIDWKDHFEYLVNFFKDKRYLKINNMPLLLIYKPYQIKRLEEIIKYWNVLAIENGFEGIYIIETLTPGQSEPLFNLSKGIVFYEPGHTIMNTDNYTKLKIIFKLKINKILKTKLLLNKFNYDNIYKKIINRDISSFEKEIFLGAFTDYDDTPRKSYGGLVFYNSSPEKFRKYFKEVLKKSKKLNSEFIFLTAWNEWAEGAYLEPDKEKGYAFLKAVKNSQKEI